MSAALVRKSLALVDNESSTVRKNKRPKKLSNLLDTIPENQKLFRRITKKGRAEKVNLLHGTKKLTVIEARKTRKSKEKRLRDNLEKIKLIQEICTIDLGEEVTQQILERAVTKRPIESISKPKENSETVFTEEDFKKFEEEYFDE